MSTLTDITTGNQTVTAAGAVAATAGLDVSGVTGDFTLCVEVVSLTAAKTARIQLEDTVNGFTAAPALAVFDVTGQQAGQYSNRFSLRKYQLPNNQFGVANAKVRANVSQIDAGGSLILHAWLEQ